MSDFFNAFEMSPVPTPGPDAVAPEPFRGIYGMPAFVTIPTSDLAASTDFWVRGLGFFELFSIPGQVVHLRRWAFQDVLLVPAEGSSAQTQVPAMSVSFSCVLSEVDQAVEACRGLVADSVTGPRDTPWTSSAMVSAVNGRCATARTGIGMPIISGSGGPRGLSPGVPASSRSSLRPGPVRAACR